MRELAELQARAEGRPAPPPRSHSIPDSPEAFSLALPGVVEHEWLLEAQALLESTSTLERSKKLDEAFEEAIKFTTTQVMLQSLGGGFGGS